MELLRLISWLIWLIYAVNISFLNCKNLTWTICQFWRLRRSNISWLLGNSILQFDFNWLFLGKSDCWSTLLKSNFIWFKDMICFIKWLVAFLIARLARSDPRNIGFPNGRVFRYGNFFIPRVEKSSKISTREKNLVLPRAFAHKTVRQNLFVPQKKMVWQ